MYRMMVITVLNLTLLCSTAVGAGVDNTLYANVLERFVKNGLVDYAGIKAHPEDLDGYLELVGRVDPGKLDHDDRLAFYINLYNAATIKLVVAKYPVDSIKDIGSIFTSPWKLKTVMLNGKMVSLDHIEHGIVRPAFKEPRVHFALNCSAISCPPLLREPYEGDMLDSQLQLAAEMFINNGKDVYLKDDMLYVSKIFDWFEEDFPDDLAAWLAGFASGSLQRELEKCIRGGKKVKVRFLKYDWSLNRQGR